MAGIFLGFLGLAGLGAAGLGCRERRLADSTMTAAPSDSVRLQIEVPAQVPVGRPVPIVLRARNVGARRRELYLLGRTATFDVTVTAEDGRTVWRRLQDSTVPAILQVRTLAPGEALEARYDWDQRANGGAAAGPGRYSVRGTLLTGSPPPLETPPAALEVVAR